MGKREFFEVAKEEAYFTIDKDGWSVNPYGSDEYKKTFKSIKDVEKFIKDELPRDVKPSDLEELNENDLQANYETKDDRGTPIGVNLNFWVWKKIPFKTKVLEHKLKGVI